MTKVSKIITIGLEKDEKRPVQQLKRVLLQELVPILIGPSWDEDNEMLKAMTITVHFDPKTFVPEVPVALEKKKKSFPTQFIEPLGKVFQPNLVSPSKRFVTS
jgi:hypothetical protein